MTDCKFCGEEIFWSFDDFRENGKWIPYEDEEFEEPHSCEGRPRTIGDAIRAHEEWLKNRKPYTPPKIDFMKLEPLLSALIEHVSGRDRGYRCPFGFALRAQFDPRCSPKHRQKLYDFCSICKDFQRRHPSLTIEEVAKEYRKLGPES